MAELSVDRAQVMAYRVAAQQLDRRTRKRPADLDVLDLGIQEYTPDSTRIAIAARTSADPDDDRLVMVWATRGAPHLHRRADLVALSRALWPVSDADASARINSAQIRAGVKLGIGAFTASATATHEVVTKSMPRGEVSTAVSEKVPRSLTYDCRSCEARHIAGNAWQHAGLAAGVLVESRGTRATLGPIPHWPGIPSANEGIGELLTAYLRLLGPATPAEAAKYLGSTTGEMKKVWPGGLAEVTVDGRKTWLPESAVAALRKAKPVPGVRFVPPMDPLLQARDREILVPDKAGQKALWRPLGNPGALLVDGEIAGTWRAKMAGKRLDLTVTGIGTLDAATRKDVEKEAPVVAGARGVTDVKVIVE